MSVLELKIPPLIVFVLVAAVMMILNVLWLPGFIPYPINIISSIIFLLLGGWIMRSGIMALRRAGTTLNAFKPENATALVQTGIFGRTRNPIYLALLIWLTGLAVYLQNPLTFVGLPVFIIYMNRFQIMPEERALTELFGQEYDTYKNRVGRWL